MSDFSRTCANLMRARFPFLYVATWEEERVVESLLSIANNRDLIKTQRTVYSWSQTEGLVQLDSVSDKHKALPNSHSPLQALEYIEGYGDAAIFVLKDFHAYFGVNNRAADMNIIRKLRDLVPSLKKSPRPKNVVFLSPTICLPHELQKDITIVDFPLPTFEEVRQLLDEMIHANGELGRIAINLDSVGVEKLSKAALGLTLQEAENAFARAMVENGRLDVGDVEIVLNEKHQIVKKTGILEFVKSDINLDDVGGLENLKKWLLKRNESWLDSAKRYNLPAPKGVLITGVPGCGKSLIAKAISAMWQLPLLRLDLGKIFSGIVGSSEENMRNAIATAEAISPSILWIDEIEKGISTNGAGDSGTSNRIFGSFLTWMQEKINPVFVVATANNIHSLPPELLRKGRFDEIFFVDLPTNQERRQIFSLHLEKRLINKEILGDFFISNDVLDRFADLTEGFVGAEIEQTVIASLFEAFSEKRCIKESDFLRIIENTVPLSVTQSEQINAIRQWADVRAISATGKEDRREYLIKESAKGQIGTHEFSNKEGMDFKTTRGGRTVDF
ncbi:AAA family ATPase [Paenibacillus glycanilyticus]|uniref:AAA family ATPase n=1 Tax=Paenibacillus glycanilyticus TaxID=126569 RepID=UPI003EBA4AFA